MRKPVLLILLLLLSIACLPAQTANPSPDTAQVSGKASELPTFTGCVQLDNGRYTLTEEDGTKHDLVGSTGKLRKDVGHEVEVGGKPGTRTVDNTPPGGASSVTVQSVFEVKTVKKIADQCK